MGGCSVLATNQCNICPRASANKIPRSTQNTDYELALIEPFGVLRHARLSNGIPKGRCSMLSNVVRTREDV